MYETVLAIVTKAQSDGPLVQPPPPSLTITPPSVSGPAGSAVGPFTVNTDTGRRRRPRATGEATVIATGGSMFSDAAGTVPIADGATVPSGQKIWMRSTGGSSSAVLQATATATVPSGNVYLYDGNIAGVNDAQRLILAENATLTTTVQATAQFLPPGSLVVKKTIAGPAAGTQGRVGSTSVAMDGVHRADFVIPAGTPAGDRPSQRYENIPAGTVCTVTETSDGSVVGTDVDIIGAGQEAIIPSGDSKMVHITDTYRFVGSLLLRKTIAGPGAGQQGEIRIHTVCDGKALTPDFVIPGRDSHGRPGQAIRSDRSSGEVHRHGDR